jgi:hypothetical protein
LKPVTFAHSDPNMPTSTLTISTTSHGTSKTERRKICKLTC